MIRTDVVVAVPAGSTVPERLDTLLSSGLAGSGWDPPANTSNSMPPVSTVLAIRALWEQLS
jgi:hypothetical protein